jgi:hypothetical protein
MDQKLPQRAPLVSCQRGRVAVCLLVASSARKKIVWGVANGRDMEIGGVLGAPNEARVTPEGPLVSARQAKAWNEPRLTLLSELRDKASMFKEVEARRG